uniref:Uncharacterized protein n=1 Tax=Rhizophora mucronata TaxID=61149 RepID=A0A2P2PUV5_RHIMU
MDSLLVTWDLKEPGLLMETVRCLLRP